MMRNVVFWFILPFTFSSHTYLFFSIASRIVYFVSSETINEGNETWFTSNEKLSKESSTQAERGRNREERWRKIYKKELNSTRISCSDDRWSYTREMKNLDESTKSVSHKIFKFDIFGVLATYIIF